MSYHNTTFLQGPALKEAMAKAAADDVAILTPFKNWRVEMSPSKVHEIMQKAGRHTLITSVRRSITNLTKSKDLICTGKTVEGPHKRPEHTWSINPAKHPTPTGTTQPPLFTN